MCTSGSLGNFGTADHVFNAEKPQIWGFLCSVDRSSERARDFFVKSVRANSFFFFGGASFEEKQLRVGICLLNLQKGSVHHHSFDGCMFGAQTKAPFFLSNCPSWRVGRVASTSCTTPTVRPEVLPKSRGPPVIPPPPSLPPRALLPSPPTVASRTFP